VLTHLADHPINRLDDILPWNLSQRLQPLHQAAAWPVLYQCLNSGIPRVVNEVFLPPGEDHQVRSTKNMTRFILAAIAVLLATISPLRAQAKLDEEAVHNLPQAFCAAFNRHDGRHLAQIMAEDIDFVTVGATRLHGKSDFE
jgi:hypothetical protein